ncbi:MAG: type II secretion system F family protein [Planctomycetota bacterium]|nr:type II secretion system F family protein [Planctomycetota bacterium]
MQTRTETTTRSEKFPPRPARPAKPAGPRSDEDMAMALARPGKGVKRDDVIFFATQLAVMVDTGVPLTDALEAIGSQSPNLGLRALVKELAEDVRGGVEFSVALEKYPHIFNNLFVALVKASEASGTMGRMLQRVSEYLEEQHKIRRKVIGAMTYPLCMLGFCILVVVGILVFIMPRFEKIYASKGSALPVPTQILMAVSHTLTNYWYAVLGGVIAAAAGAFWYLRTPAGQILMDQVRIRLPLLGKMYRKACLARSLRTMATMTTSGVPVLDGLEITARVSGNHFYSRMWLELAEGVREGQSLSGQLFSQTLVPATVSQMIDAGERTGRMAMVMDRVAKFCEDDLRNSIESLTSLIEPAMIIIMGGVIGGIAMALLLPVFSISKVMAK